MLSDTPVLVDSCTLINLQATGEPELLLKALSATCLACDVVQRESIFLRAEQTDLPPEQINLDLLFQANILFLCKAETPEEEALYVSLAAELDDGEALSLAISSGRGYGLATDDRKARRLARELGSVPLFSTAEILHSLHSLDEDKIGEMIRRIEFRARFTPHSTMPLYDWWNAHKHP
jgi:predicted nucleic acid-binding protein